MGASFSSLSTTPLEWLPTLSHQTITTTTLTCIILLGRTTTSEGVGTAEVVAVFFGSYWVQGPLPGTTIIEIDEVPAGTTTILIVGGDSEE